MYVGDDRSIEGFGRERGHLEELGVDGRIILKLIYKNLDGESWTGLIWRRMGDRWRSFVDPVMDLRVPSKGWDFSLS